MIYYQTKYIKFVKGQKKFLTYETKKLTGMHQNIRNIYPGSVTIMCDTSIPWPFGVYAEVVKKSPK